MKRKLANCPACGGLLEFPLSTALVTVCSYCHSVLAHEGKNLEDHGKVADLVETDSRIYRGLNGRFGKKPFEVIGRVQYQHPAGGVWDEWYLTFPGDQVKWLAEAQGKLYLMAEKRVKDQTPLPGFEVLAVGESLELPGGKTLIVAEKGLATIRSADGDIPWAFRPNAEHRFADLHGSDGEFATIEYGSNETRFFLGREVSPQELGLPVQGGVTEAPTSANTTALQINCPHCAGPLALMAPDETQRVCCPNCHSLLDCEQGKLRYLKTLHFSGSVKPVIPLGSVGKLADVEYTVIGFMERYVSEAGEIYPWTEYLLYSSAVGFRWLICNKGHWSFAESVTLGVKPSNNSVTFEGTEYKLFDRGTARVRYVVGEFYWRVHDGEQAATEDYIAPPHMLSFEQTKSSGGGERNVSKATYLPIESLESAFGLTDLPRPWGIGTIQPNPHSSDVWLIWAGFLVVSFVLLGLYGFLVPMPGGTHAADRIFHFFVALVALTAWPVGTVIVQHQREVSRWKDSDYSPYAQGESNE